MRTIIRDNYTPQLGQYHERIIIDSVNEKVWLFDCDGVFTDITRVIVENEYGEHKNHAISQKFFTDEVQKIAKDLDDETAARIAADEDLDERKQDKLTAGDGIVLENNVISADLVQTTGQGADKIMSQKAVTDTLFADNNQNKIQIGGVASSAGFSTAIGGFSEADTYGVAVGHSANAAQDSVALGYASVASERNTVSVGSQVNKRRIVNVADPVNDQDAATKKYVDDEIDGIETRIEALGGRVEDIEEVIPAAATAQNQLADKNFVNSSIATNTGSYVSDNGQPFSSLADLQNYSGPLMNNDYAFVVGTDQQGNTTYTRYKYNADTQTWAVEYVLNNSSFTANQWAAINSGITSGDVSKLTGLANIQNIGANLTLTNGTLSAVGVAYTAGSGVDITNNTISVDNTIARVSDVTTLGNAGLIWNKYDGTTEYWTVSDGLVKTLTLPWYDAFAGATSSASGASGLVPQPLAGDQDKFLKGDGTWGNVSAYTLPPATTTTLGGVIVGNNLTVDANGVLDATDTTYTAGTNIQISAGNVISATDTTYPAFTGATTSAAGTSGLVPAPAAGDDTKFLSGDGTWKTVTSGSSYTAGNGIDIDANNEISIDTTVVATQTDLAGKQDTLTAGTNITIANNTISAVTNNINSTDWSALWQ